MKMIEGDIAWTDGPRGQALGELLVATPAASIYCLPEPRPQLAKIYGDGVDRAQLERKIAAMLDAPPHLPDIVDGDERHVQIAWPDAALRDRNGRFVGFLFPAVDLAATQQLEWILQERQARAMGLVFGLAARITLAANIATAIAELHAHGHHVVDLNPGKLRLNAQSQNIAIVDCDSFSIQGKDERFAAELPATGEPAADYLAPEFHDRLIPPDGEESQDRFALAVLIFQLLNFGIHPFTGIPADDRVPTDIPGRIVERCYAYGVIPNLDMRPSPVSGHTAMPDALRSLFDRAFEDGAATRPSASEWAELLKSYALPWNASLQACAAVAGHQHFVDLPCADCARSELIISAANASDMSLVHVPDPHAVGVRPFGAPQSVEEVVPPPVIEWETVPAAMPLPSDEPRKGLPPGAFIAIKTVAVLVLVTLGVKFGLGYADRHAVQPAPGPVSLAEPEDAPVAPSPDPDLMGFPSMEKEEALTEGYAMTAARAIAKGDRGAWETAMSTLRGRIPAHAVSPPDAHQAEFAAFSASITPASYNERQRQNLISDLHQALRDNPFDDEAAFELGWLSLLGGEREEAKKYYAHALWVNPDRANAWYGLGVVAGNAEQTTGALAAAELLTTDPSRAQQMRDTFPPLMLRLCGIKPEYFAMLQSKARQIADQNRPVAASTPNVAPASGAASAK